MPDTPKERADTVVNGEVLRPPIIITYWLTTTAGVAVSMEHVVKTTSYISNTSTTSITTGEAGWAVTGARTRPTSPNTTV